MQEVTLFVKAGRGAECLGASLSCQHAHLLARLKLANLESTHKLRLILLDVANPPPDFASAGFTRLPAVLHSDGTGSDENVVAFLERSYSDGVLNPGHHDALEAAENITKDIYPLFCEYMQGGDLGRLQSALEDLDMFLRSKGHSFLLGDEMSLLDCQVLPQLHEVRIVLGRMKGHSIPEDLRSLWMYLFHAYMKDAFTVSCPPDMEILLDWIEKTGEPLAVIRMPEWLPESYHGSYHSFNVPNMCVCPPCPTSYQCPQEKIEPPE